MSFFAVRFQLILITTVFTALLITICVLAIHTNERNTELVAICKDKGGVVLNERGIFRACLNPDAVISMEIK